MRPSSVSGSHPLTRRDWMRIGGLSLFGLGVADLSRWRARAEACPAAKYRANSCVFLFLFGGPSQIDLWDMKPQAPREIRGEFRPIATNAAGIELCEHLPFLARQADKICLVRSMTHKMSVHGPACSEIYTGREYFGPPVTDQALPEDWPSLAAMVARFGRSPGGLPASVSSCRGHTPSSSGKTGGLPGRPAAASGEQWNPFLIPGDPSRPDFEVQGIRLPSDVSLGRFQQRRELHRALGGQKEYSATRLIR